MPAPHLQPDPQPLRVALFSGNYNYVVDGPVRALNKLVAHLEARGHEVLVFAPTVPEPAFAHSGTLVPVPSVALPGSRSEYRLGLGLNRQLRRRLDAFAPTLIHIAAPDFTAYQALAYAERCGAPAVASFHTRFDTYPRYYGAKWLEGLLTRYLRHFYARCEQVYPPSQSMADELRRDGIGRDLRIWTRGVEADLFNPTRRDTAWRRSLGFADAEIVVAFVGRVVLEKGIDIFADAVRAAAEDNPNIRALVVGEGPERARFEGKLPGAVFVGHLDGAALARAYASADVFFNPSVTETFGNVTLEAMASGLPTLCADASGSVSLVDDGATGFVSPHADGAQGYSARILRLAGDPGLRRLMGDRARLRSLDFNWSQILDGLIEHYREAVASHAMKAKRA